MRKSMSAVIFFLVVSITGGALGAVSTDIEQANKNGKAVFLVVTEPGAKEADKTMNIAAQAQKLAAPEATVMIEMNRADPVNAPLVAKYQLAGAPLPLILVVAANGVVAGGTTADRATPDVLIKMIPSPKKSEVLQALHERKAVFVVAGRKSMPDIEKVVKSCEDACRQMKNKAVFVFVDMDDTNEASFLARLNVKAGSSRPTTSVVNPQGQVTGAFSGPIDVNKIILAASKKAGGCCSGGGNKRCKIPKGKKK